MSEHATWRDDYELVGPAMDPRMTALSIGAANTMRDRLSQQFFPWAMHQLPNYEFVAKLSAAHDVTKYALSYGPTHDPATQDFQVAGFTGVRLTHMLNGWKLRCAVSRYKPNAEPNKTAVRYFIDVENDWVLQARVEARVLTSDSDEYYASLLDDETEETSIEINRKAYERAMQAKDCIRIETLLTRAVHRRMATRRLGRTLPS